MKVKEESPTARFNQIVGLTFFPLWFIFDSIHFGKEEATKEERSVACMVLVHLPSRENRSYLFRNFKL